MSDTRWCDSCGGEFHAWVLECPDCGLALESTEPREDVGLHDESGARLVPSVGGRTDRGVTALRWVAVVAGLFWLVAVVLTAWAMWEATSGFASAETTLGLDQIATYPAPPDTSSFARIRSVVLAVTQSTSPYLMVAVLAGGFAGLLDHRRVAPVTEPPARDPAMVEPPEEAGSEDRASSLRTVLVTPRGASQVLISIGIATFGVWAFHFVNSAWAFWDSLANNGWTTPSGMLAAPDFEPLSLMERLRITFLVTMEVSGAYLLVSVVAYGLGVAIRAREAP